MKKLLCYFLIYSLIFTNSCTSLLSLVSRTEHEEITTFRKVFEEHNKVNVETSGNTIKITATRVLNFKDDKVTRPKGSIGGGDDWIYFVALLGQGLLSLIFTSKVFPAQPNNPKLGWKEDKNFWAGYALIMSDLFLTSGLSYFSRIRETKEGIEEKPISNKKYKLQVGDRVFDGLTNDNGQIILENIKLDKADLLKGVAVLTLIKNSQETYTEKIDIDKFESLIRK